MLLIDRKYKQQIKSEIYGSDKTLQVTVRVNLENIRDWNIYALDTSKKRDWFKLESLEDKSTQYILEERLNLKLF